MNRGRREALPAAGLLAAALAVVLLPLAGGGPLVYRDLSQNFLPLRILAASLRAAGDGVWWNPYLAGGIPLAANPNTLLLHPAWGLDRLLAPPTAIALTVAGHLALAAAFLALFLRRRGASPYAAAGGTAALGLSGIFLSLGTLPNLLTAAAWIPPAMYFLDRFRTGSRWAFPAAVGCGALSLMPADPACALALAAGAWLAAGTAGTAAHPPGIDSGAARRRGRAAPALSFLALSAGVAMVQLLPAWHVLSGSARGAGFAAEEAGKWSLHPGRLPGLAVPGWIGDPTRFDPDRYWGAAWLETGLPFLLSVYVGLPVLALAAIGVAGGATGPRGGARRRVGIALAGAGLALALGRHVPGAGALVGSLPVLSLYRYPEKFLIPALFGIALLVSVGIDRLAGSRRTSIAAGVLIVSAAAGGMAWSAALAESVASGAFGRPLDAVATGAFRLASLRGALAGLAAGALLLSAPWIGARFGPAMVRGLAASLVCADLVLAAVAFDAGGFPPWRQRVNPAAPPEFLAARPPDPVLPARPAVSRGGDEAGGSGGIDFWRTRRLPRPEGFVFRSPDASMVWGFLWDRITLARSWPAAFEAPDTFDLPTDRFAPRAAAAASHRESRAASGERVRLWSIASVRAVTAYGALAHPALRETARMDGMSRPPLVRYENERALPPARFVTHARAAAGPDEALDLALDPSLDPAATVIVESGAPIPAAAPVAPVTSVSAGAGNTEIRSGKRTAGAWSVDFEAARPGWLVVAENHDPGWKATLDGRSVAFERAYGFLGAVRVDRPGPHTVMLTYRPRGLAAGAAVAALAAAAALAIAWFAPAPGRAE